MSIGNVPQLVSDLLIHSLKLDRIGFLDQDSLVPVSGVREDSNQVGVTVPLEGKINKYMISQEDNHHLFFVVYQSKDHQWTVIQQRSPTLKGKRQEFIKEMTAFASQFKQVVLITSMDATRRLDSQINGPPFRVWGNGESKDKAISLGVPLLENKKDEKDRLELPGSGLARHLYEALNTKVPTTLLIMFALEGGNKHIYKWEGLKFNNYIY